jgi:Flp pilus assembly protein TadG
MAGPLRRNGHTFAARLRRDIGGGTAMIFALALPAVLTVGLGAVDLASVHADKSRLQDTADAAALGAAKQLNIAEAVGIKARAEETVRGQLKDLDGRMTYTVTTTVSDDRTGVKIAIDGTRSSFFGNMLPPGGWPVHASATAGTMAQMPLCVLSSGKTPQDTLALDDSAKLTAPGCLVHSNGDVAVSGVAWLQAAATQSSGLATGRISPGPQPSAPVISDPFDNMNLKVPAALCNPLDLLFVLGVQVLNPGVHCGNLKAMKNATVKLLPGEHYFLKGSLSLNDNSVLSGDDVVLIFDDQSSFSFKDSSQISLHGRRSGAFAGFVIATTRKNKNTFTISSNSARELLGTIYVPSAALEVKGAGNSVADQSAWTVVVAKSLKLSGSANLVVNANYNGSTVPVPDGVGPTSGVKLTR